VQHCDSRRIRDQLDVTSYSVYFTSCTLNMFRTLIHPSSGACNFSIVSPHWSFVLVSMCVGVSVWLGWGGIRVAGWSLPQGYHPNPVTPKFQHISKQEHTTILVLLPHMVCDALAAGGRRSGAGQEVMRPGWGKMLEQLPSSRTHSLLPRTLHTFLTSGSYSIIYSFYDI